MLGGLSAGYPLDEIWMTFDFFANQGGYATSILDKTMADVLISGGGVAGSALAILLGRRGPQVELFERYCFPKEKPCGEGLMPAGVAVLYRLGVGEAVGDAPFYAHLMTKRRMRSVGSHCKS
jgi:hypothetical protein